MFKKTFTALAAASDVLMIDATHLKAHRTAARFLKSGLFPSILEIQKVI